MRALATTLLFCALLTYGPAPARAWDWFRSENSDVREGNELLEKKQLDKALAAYGSAAKSLPGEAGVHLDRGIALLQAGKASEAREALRLATQGNASPEVRGKANYNLGLSFMKDADTLAKEENLDEAQKLLRESADAFKSSLRASPKNRDAAWNLELAKRRLVDLEKKQQEKKDQEKKDQEKKEQEEKKKNEDDQKKDEQNQDGDKSDEKKDDQQKNEDGQDAGQPKPDEADAGSPSEPDAGSEQKQPPKPEEKEEEGQPKDEPGQTKPAMPEHMQQALDALENSEENLQKHRAAMRARQRPRRIEKDW